MTLDDLRTRFRGALRLWAVLAPLVVAGVLAVAHREVAAATAVLVLVLVVVAFASTGDRVAGVLAAVSSGLWFDWFLTEPYGRLTISDPEDVEAAVLLVLVGVAVSQVASWGVRHRERAGERAGYLRGLTDAADTLAGTDVGSDEVVRRVEQEVALVLGAERCRFVAGPGPGRWTTVLRRDGSLVRGEAVLDVDRHGLPTDDEVRLLVGPPDAPLGTLHVTAATRVARPTLEQRRVAALLADLLASGAAPSDARGQRVRGDSA